LLPGISLLFSFHSLYRPLACMICHMKEFSVFVNANHSSLHMLLCALAVLIYSSNSLAQTDNYWSWNFNTESTLMSGAVVAGSAGPSAIYYNPALIDQEKMSSLSLSANVFSFQFYKIENYAGEGLDASSALFKVQPRFISWVLPVKSKRFGLQVAVLSPISEEIEFSINHQDSLDIVNRTLGDETYVGRLNYYREYSDIQAGIGFSFKQSDRFSIGVSLFVSDKILKYTRQQTATAYQEGDTVDVGGTSEAKYISQSNLEERMNYWYLSLVFKLGVIYRFYNNRMSLGLNVTFPNIPLVGNADIRKGYLRSNVYDDSAGSFTSNENSVNLEDDNTSIRIKTPFSVALGAQYISESGKTTLLLTVEYFHKIDAYKSVDSSIQAAWLPAYISEELNGDSHMAYTSHADPTVNAGVGIKQRISQLVTYLGGFRTDFSATYGNSQHALSSPNQMQKAPINKYHFTSGVAFNIKRLNIITGVQYTFGRHSKQPQGVNFSDPYEYIPETDQSLEGTRTNTAKIKLDEFALFLGLDINLEKKQSD
jgi:hypothetical protein